MLSPNELASLYKIISDKNQTFEEISKLFNNTFKKESHIKVSSSLNILLEDNVLNAHQRIISYFILYEIIKNEKMEINPFLSIILERLKITTDKKEQNFLIDFLCNQINYLNLTVDKYLKDNIKEQRINITQIQMQWDKYYKEILRKKNIKIDKDDKIRPFIYDRKNITNISNLPNINLLGDINNNNEIINYLNLNRYNSSYMSYFPVNNCFFANEPIILVPSLKHNFIWEKK